MTPSQASGPEQQRQQQPDLDGGSGAGGDHRSTPGLSGAALVQHLGGCHCGTVRFSVWAPAKIEAIDCNCSICKKKQNIHFIVPKARFTLLAGKDSLVTYTFNTHQAKHTFCRICGVQSFYSPRSNPDGFGVMPHCLDEGTVTELVVDTFDGKHWEESMRKAPDIRLRSKL